MDNTDLHVYRARHGYADGLSFSRAEPEEFYEHNGFCGRSGERLWEYLGTMAEFVETLNEELPSEVTNPGMPDSTWVDPNPPDKGYYDSDWVEENCVGFWHEG